MKKIFSFTILLFLLQNTFAQFDPFTTSLVYHEPAMDKVTVRKEIFKKSNDTTLTVNIYYPPSFSKKEILPVVIFNNGIGSNDLPDWKIYKDWAKLAAANGMIGITHQSRQGKALKDTEDLIDFLREKSGEFSLDKERIAIWVCSANSQTGLPLAMQQNRNHIRALALYYGIGWNTRENPVKRQDLELLVVRAGLDSHNINRGLDDLIRNALEADVHLQVINYPEGQHAFDAFDNNERSRQVIRETISFLKDKLAKNYPANEELVMTVGKLRQMILVDKKLDEALTAYQSAVKKYSAIPGQSRFYNQVLNDQSLTEVGYELMRTGRNDEALTLFKKAIEIFPDAANTYDALSDGYQKIGDNAKVVEYAKLALQKIEGDKNINPQFAQAIRESAEGKIKEIENPEPENYPGKRAHHELVYDDDKKMIVMTAGSTPTNGGQSGKFFNDIWQYNGTWTKGGKAGDVRSGIRLAYDTKRKKLFSYGGFGDPGPLAELRVLEGNEWKTLTDNPEMKAAEGGMVYDSNRDKLIAFGGSSAREAVNSTTWEWDGTSWSKKNIAGPGGRAGFAMVYDSKRKKTILFGGGGEKFGDRFGDTWEYDGKEWKKVSDTGPGARSGMGYAFDTKRNVLIIFGGYGTDGMKGDTWSWDGKEWKKLSETGPSKRVMGYMAYDKNRDKVVLFGGRLGWPNDAQDTWEWDGTKWSEIK